MGKYITAGHWGYIRLLLTLWVYPLRCPAQDKGPYTVAVRHYSLQQGLPNRSVTAITQDWRGYIWIGTINGAYRFDGTRFVALPARKQPTPNEAPFFIEQIVSAPDSTLWFLEAQHRQGQEIRLVRPGQTQPISFEKYTGRSLPTPKLFPALSIGERGQAKPSAQHLIFYTQTGTVYRYVGHGQFKRLYQSAQPVLLYYVHLTRQGSILLSLTDPTNIRHELVELDTAGRVVRQQLLPKRLIPTGTDAQGGLYLYNAVSPLDTPSERPQVTAKRLDSFLYRLDAQGRFTPQPIVFPRQLFPEISQKILFDTQVFYDAQHDLFWCLGRNTAFAWHPTQGVVFDLPSAGFPIGSLPFINRIHFDRSGAVWLGSSDGVYVLTLEPRRFDRYLYREPTSVTGFTHATRGLVSLGGSLWVNASYSWLVDLKTGHPQQAGVANGVLKEDLAEQTMAIRAADGRIWTVNRELTRVDPRTQQTEQYPLQNDNFCYSLWPDGRQNLWLGYQQGISYFDVRQKRNLPFRQYNGFLELAQNQVNGFFPDKRAGGVWITASSGLYLLDTLRGIVARYSSTQPAPHKLPFNNITAVLPDPDQPGLYWLASRGGGLIRWERATGRYRQFTQANGLLNNTLYCLYTDHPNPARRRDKNRLWFTTDYGLVSFDKRTGTNQTFLPKDGISHEEFNFTSHTQGPDGRLFFGGLNGVTAFQPNDIAPAASLKAPLVITNYEQLDAQTGTMVKLPYQTGQLIDIPTSRRGFMLSFAVLDYRYPNQMRLWYRIEGWQDAWASQPEADLRLNGLPPGRYQLQVRMQNINGQWASDALSVSIWVHSPIYQQTWFIGLCILLLVAGIWAIFWWRSRRSVLKTQQLEAEVARRTAQIEEDNAIIAQQAVALSESAATKARFFANVSHEFRTPLTLLLGPIQYLKKQVTKTTQQQLLVSMERNAHQLLDLVNDLLDLTKTDTAPLVLTEQPTDLGALIQQVVAGFDTQANYLGIKMSAVTPDAPIWSLMDNKKVETILKNLLANALRFLPIGGSAIVSTELTTDTLWISVADTGRGIHPDDLPHIFERYFQSNQPDRQLMGGAGIGLALCREYTNLWGGTLTVSSEWEKGSTFVVTYPYQPTDHPSIQLPAPLGNTGLPVSEATPLAKIGADSQTRMTVLVVEDNADMSAYIAVLLAQAYEVKQARHGVEAWAWLTSLAPAAYPQLIITDLMMPEMDGRSLITQLRRHAYLHAIPVIVLTAQVDTQLRLDVLQLGVADYLTKPFSESTLRTSIGNLLLRNQERKAWYQEIAGETNRLLTRADEDWLLLMEKLVRQHLTEDDFQVRHLADLAILSERQLYRQFKTLTGLSPNQFIQETRLQIAREWLDTNRYQTIKEVSFGVGFQDASYFTRLFTHRFGYTPRELLKQQEVS